MKNSFWSESSIKVLVKFLHYTRVFPSRSPFHRMDGHSFVNRRPVDRPPTQFPHSFSSPHTFGFSFRSLGVTRRKSWVDKRSSRLFLLSCFFRFLFVSLLHTHIRIFLCNVTDVTPTSHLEDMRACALHPARSLFSLSPPSSPYPFPINIPLSSFNSDLTCR